MKNNRFVRISNTSRTEFGATLDGAAANWPTPRVSDTEGGIAPNVEMNNGSFSRKNQEGVRWGVKLKDATANWPTPRVSSANGPSVGEISKGDPKHRLEVSVVCWPTPNASEHKSSSRVRENNQDNLGSAARNWPTPAARDYKGMDPPGKQNTGKPPSLYLSIPQAPTTTKDGHSCSITCRRLNPLFAEMLMGLPLGWTDASEPLATELFQLWQQSLGYTLQRRNDE
jgi:hypothetical protein